jgi:ubiquinone/menaquinone biosynthesis C-methylase UbiE
MTIQVDDVASFWEAEACGERYGAVHDETRYRLEPEITGFANFDQARGMRVLEVGVGMGSDFIRFVRAGARANGVDLTSRAIAITRARLRAEHLQASLRIADAEELPFEDCEFDIVYSWGVLHHSPNPVAAIQECVRVLAPGGQLRIMLYHRHSWMAVAAWMRFCLLRGRPFRGLRYAVAQIESPGTQAFTADEIGRMLSNLNEVSVRPVLTHWDRRVFPGVSRIAGQRFGWFLLIRGIKP